MNFSHGADMTEGVTIWRKQVNATSPESWERIGAPRRARIERVSDTDALRTGALLEANITHEAKVCASEDYDARGGGMRVLKSERDGQNYMIVRVATAGTERRGGRTRYLKLSLSEQNPAVV
jgi:hypothetical protein